MSLHRPEQSVAYGVRRQILVDNAGGIDKVTVLRVVQKATLCRS